MVYRLIGERYFTAVYENMEVVELWISRFGRKIGMVHKNMINEIDLYGDLP